MRLIYDLAPLYTKRVPMYVLSKEKSNLLYKNGIDEYNKDYIILIQGHNYILTM